jgi:photosynthetic reaction center cytochrome c subunit
MTSASLLLVALVAQALSDRPAGETRKHLQVLQAVPESQLFLAMNFIAQSLDVNCDYCHVREGTTWVWDRDDKPPKATARRMMKMVMDLNAASFDGRVTVTCFTCHRGSTLVRSLPPLPPVDLTNRPPPRPTLPDASTIVTRYLDAVGARAADSLGAIVLRGTDERSQGRQAAFELSMKGPDKLLVTRTSPDQGTVAVGMDGAKGWSRTSAGTVELTALQVSQLRNAAANFNPIKVTAASAAMTVGRTERIGDRTAYVLVSGSGPAPATQLFFDTESGLLLRTIATTVTPIVPLLDQVDFDDYRLVDGVRLPFLVRLSDVGHYDTSTRRFSEIRTHVPLDDAIFRVPGQK